MFVLETQRHGCFDRGELCFDVVSSLREMYNGDRSDNVVINRVLYLVFRHVAKKGELDVPV